MYIIAISSLGCKDGFYTTRFILVAQGSSSHLEKAETAGSFHPSTLNAKNKKASKDCLLLKDLSESFLVRLEVHFP